MSEGFCSLVRVSAAHTNDKAAESIAPDPQLDSSKPVSTATSTRIITASSYVLQ
jgi:hypothetical protein